MTSRCEGATCPKCGQQQEQTPDPPPVTAHHEELILPEWKCQVLISKGMQPVPSQISSEAAKVCKFSVADEEVQKVGIGLGVSQGRQLLLVYGEGNLCEEF